MAQFVADYVTYLLPRQVTVGDKLGVHMYAVGRELYVTNLTLLTLVGVLMKALNDKGVVLDAEWIDRLNHALDGTWDPNILGQVDPAIPPHV